MFPHATQTLIHVYTEFSQVHLCLIDLLQYLLVCVRNIVEGEDAPAEAEEEESAEGNEGPEGELSIHVRCCTLLSVRCRNRYSVGNGTYHRDNLLLDQRRQRNQLEI